MNRSTWDSNAETDLFAAKVGIKAYVSCSQVEKALEQYRSQKESLKFYRQVELDGSLAQA